MAGREFVSVVGKTCKPPNYCTTERIWKSLLSHSSSPSSRYFHHSDSLTHSWQGFVRAIGDLMQGMWRSLPLVACEQANPGCLVDASTAIRAIV